MRQKQQHQHVPAEVGKEEEEEEEGSYNMSCRVTHSEFRTECNVNCVVYKWDVLKFLSDTL